MKGRDIKKIQTLRRLSSEAKFQPGEIALEQLNGSARLAATPAAAAASRGFTSCGHACIYPRRLLPSWPPCQSSPRHSCCDTPGKEKGTEGVKHTLLICVRETQTLWMISEWGQSISFPICFLLSSENAIYTFKGFRSPSPLLCGQSPCTPPL